jgi:hypothetical protein
MPESKRLLLLVIGALGLPAGCGTSAAAREGQPQLVALGPSSGNGAITLPTTSEAPTAPLNPLERQTAMERLRVQIQQKTRTVPEPRFSRVIRPVLERQLRAMGFDQQEITHILPDRGATE